MMEPEATMMMMRTAITMAGTAPGGNGVPVKTETQQQKAC